MKLWSLIVFLGICSFRTEAVSPGIIYNIDGDGILTRVSSPDELDELNLDGLGIKKIQENVFDGYSLLGKLSMQYNQLTKLSPSIFSALKSLHYLDLSNNNLSTLNGSFVGLNALSTLKLANNSINFLQKGDLFGLPQCISIKIEGNNLQSLTSDIFDEPSTSAESLFAQSNPQQRGVLQNANIFELKHIKICKTDDGTLRSVNEVLHSEEFGNCSRKIVDQRERILDLSGLELRKFQRGWYQLSKFEFDGLNLSNNAIIEITPELLNDLPRNVKIIDLENNYIEIIEKNVMKNSYIRRLFLGYNSLRQIEDNVFQSINNLFHLSMPHNRLRNLTFAKTLPRSIIQLDLHNNLIKESNGDALINVKNLVFLSIDNNAIEEFDVNIFRQLTELEKLTVSSNFLTSIEPEIFLNQNKLVHLDLSHNKISGIKSEVFKGLTMLRTLNLNNNNIQKITTNFFSALLKTNIMNLNLASNEIDTIERNSFANMTISVLSLSNNRIGDESIAPYAFNQANIGKLYLSNNSMKYFSSSPYVNIRNLKQLFVDNNQISQIKMHSTTSLGTLHKLDLSGNQVYSLPNEAFCGLRKEMGVTIVLRDVPVRHLQSCLFDCFQFQE